MSTTRTGTAPEQKVTKRSGNVASFKDSLSAIDTYGNEYKAPTYGINDVLKAIPKECFQRRLTTSFYYVFRDIAVVASMMYVANTFIPLISNVYLRGIGWTAYAITLSLPYTGLWVLAHECGHQAFSDYGWVNDSVGWVLHSYLMVPFFSWKFTHGRHHKATGNLAKDTVFLPRTKQEFINMHGATSLNDVVSDTPAYALYHLILQQFGGWWAHLFTNVTGQKFEGQTTFNVNHFKPSAPIFESKEYWYVVLSDVGILSMLTVTYFWYQTFGGFNLFINWFLPYVFCNHWLVFITFLQHTDPVLPHYEASAWSFSRGAACTIDREFGFVGTFFLHDIIETHVLHHFVSRIPFYNARPASEAIKPVLGDSYKHSDENMWVSLWKSARTCQFVDGDEMKMFRNVNGYGVKPTA
ncbi:unnamed protein product [Kuraishia capsulata CBS 1993]|uniref:Fatty acid desaturase domain-containing protein n=1 Tax=Kuraishia capsulata CBS 1993 TaxID=1382522 RepID=W6MSY0_9ASCO|nr:uncharacterized protein KUCA_T00005823001 [Kuraishia capsulata CBS 1993]CDK29829.1 unnamed protein product [Kuraishia capsulata CBS 1993]